MHCHLPDTDVMHVVTQNTYFGRMQQHLVRTGKAGDSTETERMPGFFSSAGNLCYSVV
jgi:hypothetical protein